MNNMTIKKISELAGVSATTVSFVLNNKKGVSEKTRKKVLDIIERENYIPNINSRRLILQRSFNVAFVTNEAFCMYNDLFATGVMKSVADSFSKIGYSTLLMPQLDEFYNSHLAASIRQRNLDGLIVFHDLSADLYQGIGNSNLPLVVIDSHMPNPPYPCIRIDYERAAYTAVRHLISQGHMEIACIGIEKLPNFFISCFNGYKKALAEVGLSFKPQWVENAEYGEEDAFEAMTKILNSGSIPTAVFCCSDLMAIGGMRAARQKGFKVPQQISFVGIDDIFISKYYYPALTTVHIDVEEMGKKSMEMLHAQIEGTLEKRIYTVRSDNLVVRESVVPRPK